jgi:DNA-binding transcriptional ArsR family regulator
MVTRARWTRRLMACLGDASRFRLVQVLVGGPRCVTDLASAVGLSQSCTTRHLQALERRRVVVGTRDGKRVMYRLRTDEAPLRSLLAWALRAGERRTASGARTAKGRLGAGGRRPGPATAPPSEPAVEPPAVASVPVPGPQAGPPRARDPGPQPHPVAAGIRRPSTEIEDYLL